MTDIAKPERWVFEVEQRGMVVACGDAPDRDSALREATHYVHIYGQDGPCTATVRQEDDPAEEVWS